MSETKLKVAILIVSDTASTDPASDKCGPVLQNIFGSSGSQWEVVETKIVPDRLEDIQEFIHSWAGQNDSANCIITSGGTGFAEKDNTPEVSTVSAI